MTAHDQLWVRRLDTPTARKLLLGSAHLREAWTDFGDVGVGRRTVLTQNDNFRQHPTHPGVDPVKSHYLEWAIFRVFFSGSACVHQ